MFEQVAAAGPCRLAVVGLEAGGMEEVGRLEEGVGAEEVLVESAEAEHMAAIQAVEAAGMVAVAGNPIDPLQPSLGNQGLVAAAVVVAAKVVAESAGDKLVAVVHY